MFKPCSVLMFMEVFMGVCVWHVACVVFCLTVPSPPNCLFCRATCPGAGEGCVCVCVVGYLGN